MRFVIEGRLRRPCGLPPAEYFALAVREWETVLRWLASGVALAYGRPLTPSGGTLLIEASSEAEAHALATSLPLAPYADITVRRSDGQAARDGAASPALTADPVAGRPLPGRITSPARWGA